nr:uroporphyrinogen-III synthase [uncultured Dongia sp.]
MRILITRPKQDADSFAATLIAQGQDVTVEPLLTIQPTTAPAIDLDGVQAILFTSANGVRCFAAASPRRDLRIFAVGDASAEAATAAGFAKIESAAGDVGSLATLVTDRLHPRDGALLHAAGSSLAGDLKGQLEAAGFVVRRVVLYDAVPAAELSPSTLMNLRLGGIDAIALFSPRSARNFATLWRKAQTAETAGLQKVTALCLSAAVAREVKDLDWRRNEIAARPDSESLLALVAAEQQRRDAEMASSAQDATDRSPESGASSAKIDAEMRAAAASDAAAGAAIVAAMPKPASGGRGGSLVLGLIAGAIAGAGMVVAEPYWRPYLPLQAATESGPSLAGISEELANLKQQVTGKQAVDAEARQNIQALQAEITNWKDQLAQATGKSGSAPTPIDFGPIEMRLAALEEKLNALPATTTEPTSTDTTSPETTPETTPAPVADISPLIARIAELEGRLAAMGDATTRLDFLSSETATQKAEIETAKAKLENVSALTDRLAALEGEAKTLGAGLDAMSQNNADVALKRQRAAALVLSLGQLRGALSSDKPFSAELAAAEDLGRADADLAAKLAPALDALRPFANDGAPTLSQLQAELPVASIAQAASADATGEALGVESGWMQKTLNRLSELATLRPVGEVEGEGALAHLARAETRLAAGDLAAAVAELKGMSGQAATAAETWLVRAEARLTLDETAGRLASLSAEALVPAVDATEGPASPEPSN